MLRIHANLPCHLKRIFLLKGDAYRCSLTRWTARHGHRNEHTIVSTPPHARRFRPRKAQTESTSSLIRGGGVSVRTGIHHHPGLQLEALTAAPRRGLFALSKTRSTDTCHTRVTRRKVRRQKYVFISALAFLSNVLFRAGLSQAQYKRPSVD